MKSEIAHIILSWARGGEAGVKEDKLMLLFEWLKRCWRGNLGRWWPNGEAEMSLIKSNSNSTPPISPRHITASKARKSLNKYIARLIIEISAALSVSKARPEIYSWKA